MLFQSDAEENEGSGFAFANAELGVPWIILRGILDRPGTRTLSDEATTPATPRSSSGTSSSICRPRPPGGLRRCPSYRRQRTRGKPTKWVEWDFFSVGAVSKVVYTKAGKTHTLSGAALRRLAAEYTYAAGRLG